MLRIEMIGHVGADATIKEVNGKQVVNFSLAHTEKKKVGEDYKEYTTWVRCSYWNGEKVAPYLKTGTQVYVDGAPSVDAWKDREGEAQAAINLVVFNLQLLSSKKETV